MNDTANQAIPAGSPDPVGAPEAGQIREIEEALRGKRLQSALKRGFDILAGVGGLAVLWPVLLGIAVAIRMDDGGPVFYRQERVGRDGMFFHILKFRTMIQDADKRGLLTVGADDRITRVGRMLRRTKLDELAQLFNVLGGQMSLVGPRPEVPRYVALYTPLQRMVLRVRPGVTDLASIRYRDESALLGASEHPERTYVEEIMPAKLAINLAYLRGFSLWGDIRLLFSTVFHLGRDAMARRAQE